MCEKLLYVGTAITENYVSTAMPYLRSLSKLHCDKRFCITVGFNWAGEYIPGVDFIPVDKARIQDCDNYVCLQAGQFLGPLYDFDSECLEFLPHTVIFTDADAVFQRDFYPEERRRFLSYENDVIGVGYNNGPMDNLFEEHSRLKPTIGWPTAQKLMNIDMKKTPIYNGGFIVGCPAMWLRLQPEYTHMWNSFEQFWAIPQKTQFMLCAAVHRAKLRVDQLDYSIHSHGHFSGHKSTVTPFHTFDDQILRYKDQVVLFSHRIG